MLHGSFNPTPSSSCNGIFEGRPPDCSELVCYAVPKWLLRPRLTMDHINSPFPLHFGSVFRSRSCYRCSLLTLPIRHLATHILDYYFQRYVAHVTKHLPTFRCLAFNLRTGRNFHAFGKNIVLPFRYIQGQGRNQASLKNAFYLVDQ